MWINRRRFVKQNSPLIVKAQFIIICVCILLEIYLYALPADYMYDMVSCELILVIRIISIKSYRYLNPFARERSSFTPHNSRCLFDEKLMIKISLAVAKGLILPFKIFLFYRFSFSKREENREFFLSLIGIYVPKLTLGEYDAML